MRCPDLLGQFIAVGTFALSLWRRVFRMTGVV
ncbi:hypothetical protein STSO111631_09300 [Stackebrandtia soli]